MATPHKDYTQVPYESKQGFGKYTSPYVKGKPYSEGQDFYPDRIWRDEMSARNQFFQSPKFQESQVGQHVNTLQGRPRDVFKDDFVSNINDLILRATEERPGGIMDIPTQMWNYADLLENTRASHFYKNHPAFGNEEQYTKQVRENQDDFYLDRILRSLGGARWPYGYGVDPSDEKGMARIMQGQGNMETFDPNYGRDKHLIHDLYYKTGDAPPYTWDHLGERVSDFGKETTRSGIAGIGWLADAVAKGAGQTFNPFDIKDQPGTGYNLPRGWHDLSEYTNLVDQFRNFKYNAGESLPTEYAWNNMGYSEKKDLNDEFKKFTGSEWDLDLDYHPLTDDSAFKEWTHDIASKDIFMPSGGYDAEDQPHLNIPNPASLMGWGPDTWDLNPMDIAALVGDSLSFWGAGTLGKKAIKKTGEKTGITKMIPELIRNNPKLASLLGFTTTPLAMGAVEQAVEDKKWPDLKPEWLEEWPEWPSNDPKEILESLSKE